MRHKPYGLVNLKKGDAEATGNFIIASIFPVMIFSTITLLFL